MSSEIPPSAAAGVHLINVFTTLTIVVTIYSLVVSIPLYIFIIYTLMKNKYKHPFNSSFFTIFIAAGVCDIMAYFYYLIKKLPYWGIDLPFFLPYNQNNAYCTILYFAIWWFSFMQYQYSTLLSLNRFASIMMNKFYNKYCTIHITKKVLTVIAIYSFVLAAPILFTGGMISSATVVFDEYEVTKNFGPVFVDPTTSYIYNTIWKFNSYFRLVIVMAINLILIIKIYKMRVSMKSKFKLEITLVYAVLISTIDNFVINAYFFFRDEMTSRYQEFGRYSEWTLYLVSDIIDVCGAYSLFVTSSDIRKAVWNTVKCNN